METSEIHPSSRPGGWHVERGYRDRAKKLLKRVQEVGAKLREYLERTEGGETNHEANPFPKETLEEYRFTADATILFAAMAVEGFLNFYGVVRLGESFYTTNYERLGPQQKTAGLIATCLQKVVPNDSEITKVVRRLFERRNALVHPKAREMKETDPWPPEGDTRGSDARESVEDMERFFELFVGLDPKAEWAMR